MQRTTLHFRRKANAFDFGRNFKQRESHKVALVARSPFGTASSEKSIVMRITERFVGRSKLGEEYPSRCRWNEGTNGAAAAAAAADMQSKHCSESRGEQLEKGVDGSSAEKGWRWVAPVSRFRRRTFRNIRIQRKTRLRTDP